ncbi:unnamed protein product [Closterium sp. NIES-53]
MTPQSSARNDNSPSRRNFQTRASGETFASESDGLKGSPADSEPHSPSLWAKLGQSFNLQGVTAVASVAVSNPSLAVPHVSVPDIRWIDWKALHAAGLRAVVFDKDNTLTLPYKMQVEDGLVASLDVCRETFGSRGIAILSNSAGLKQYDPDGSLAAAMEQALGVPVILHSEKKPGGGAAELETHFGCRANEMVMVGDRCLTDIVFGNRNGLLTVLTAPLSPGEDPLVVRQARKFEDVLVTTLHRRGVQAPPQAKFSSSYTFVLPPACW